MMVHSFRNRKRSGFTLVELIVVIAIIIILMALTIGVISRIWQSMDETRTKVEEGKLAEAMIQFKTTFGKYPPSKIILCTAAGRYATLIGGSDGPEMARLASSSVDYLQGIFPGIDLTVGHAWVPGVSGPANGYYMLEGNECLVYFLGGINMNGSYTGFNTNKTNPTLPTTTGRLGPFFSFDSARLKVVSGSQANPLSVGRFPSYSDYWGTAYAYFAARSPGMNTYVHPSSPLIGSLSAAGQTVLSDCVYLCGAFCPYYESRTDLALPGAGGANWPPAMTANIGVTYFKNDSFQIVSAGRDKAFGSGGHYYPRDPENSAFNYADGSLTTGNAANDAIKKANFDNVTNFSETNLLVPK